MTNCEEGAVLLLLLRLVAATHAEAAKRSAHLNGHRYLDIKDGFMLWVLLGGDHEIVAMGAASMSPPPGNKTLFKDY